MRTYWLDRLVVLNVKQKKKIQKKNIILANEIIYQLSHPYQREHQLRYVSIWTVAVDRKRTYIHDKIPALVMDLVLWNATFLEAWFR